MPKQPKKVNKTDGFVMRNLRNAAKSGKTTVVKHGVTGIVALIMGSVIPMLQGWHVEKQHAAEVLSIRNEAASDTDAAEKRSAQLVKDLDDRTDRHIIEVENNENDKIKALWNYTTNQPKNTKK